MVNISDKHIRYNSKNITLDIEDTDMKIEEQTNSSRSQVAQQMLNDASYDNKNLSLLIQPMESPSIDV